MIQETALRRGDIIAQQVKAPLVINVVQASKVVRHIDTFVTKILRNWEREIEIAKIEETTVMRRKLPKSMIYIYKESTKELIKKNMLPYDF